MTSLTPAAKCAALIATAASICAVTAVNAATLSFDTLVGSADGTTVIGNSSVVTSKTARFTNVATDDGRTVDARITATVKDGTDFGDVGTAGNFGDAGFIPDYQPGGDTNAADLGFLFYGNGINSTPNGITVAFDFFDGTADLAGSFSQAITVAELNFAIYDVDGESRAAGGSSDQTETFSAFISDGLVSYQLGNTTQALIAAQMGDTVTFSGPNQNFSESDASGAAILTYANTSAFTLDFNSVQSYGANKNGVFSAFDGDLSLVNSADFNAPVATLPTIPLPASMSLLISAFCAMFAVNRRKSRKKRRVYVYD